ncbi:hypothetical protein RFI_09223, partial [Reticulomyxa filosa]
MVNELKKKKKGEKKSLFRGRKKKTDIHIHKYIHIHTHINTYVCIYITSKKKKKKKKKKKERREKQLAKMIKELPLTESERVRAYDRANEFVKELLEESKAQGGSCPFRHVYGAFMGGSLQKGVAIRYDYDGDIVFLVSLSSQSDVRSCMRLHKQILVWIKDVMRKKETAESNMSAVAVTDQPLSRSMTLETAIAVAIAIAIAIAIARVMRRIIVTK